jgi:hypothetical protein
MSIPLNNLALFSIALIMGMIMITEGLVIVKFQKQIIPLPSKILKVISVGLVGKEKSVQLFAGSKTQETLQTYGMITLVFGASVILSGLIYIFG